MYDGGSNATVTNPCFQQFLVKDDFLMKVHPFLMISGRDFERDFKFCDEYYNCSFCNSIRNLETFILLNLLCDF